MCVHACEEARGCVRQPRRVGGKLLQFSKVCKHNAVWRIASTVKGFPPCSVSVIRVGLYIYIYIYICDSSGVGGTGGGGRGILAWGVCALSVCPERVCSHNEGYLQQKQKAFTARHLEERVVGHSRHRERSTSLASA